jgi:hypothetical protein
MTLKTWVFADDESVQYYRGAELNRFSANAMDNSKH